MNQRIDQLWAQALDAAVPETYTRLSHSQVLKIKQVFADMIVRECMEVANIASADLIREHFGVES
jgi:exoribonuclease R